MKKNNTLSSALRTVFFNKKFKSLILVLIGIFLFIILVKIILLISLLFFQLPEKVNHLYSETFFYKNGEICFIKMNKENQYRVYTKIDDISPYIKKGIVEYEDKYFYFHPGFNIISIIRALSLNITNNKIVSGGSTISMQLARLTEPKKRNFINKLKEIFRSLQLENIYSKKKILEMYLNSIPMGGNIQGVGAASFFYFGKTPDKLTFAESSFLIGLSNSPNGNRPDLNLDNSIKSRRKVASKIANIFEIDKKELDQLLLTKIPVEKNNFDIDVISLIGRFSKLPEQKLRYLTIDRNLQVLALNILKEKMNLIGATNGGLIILDNKNMEVLSYIGSPFYKLNLNGVRLNACNIKRSPGSTLKPFIYAKAMEKGIVTEKKKILDIPKDFDGYKPKNFTNNYYGVISCDEALYRSLNIPAIYLEEKLGDDGLKSILKKNGFMNLIEKNNDLSIVLGSYPMTLEDMTTLYSSLANQGELKRLRFFKDSFILSGKRILSKESTFIISEILSETFRPDLNESWEYSKDKPKIAYKTGTSYGFVDAWAIGYTPQFTICVWIGNLDNVYTKSLTGYSVAAPVLFKIMNELGRENDKWFLKPENVGKREVCATSGMIPTKFCKNRITEYYIKHMSSNEVCNIHKRIIIDKKTGKAISMEKIKNNGNYEEKIIELWPDEVEFFIKKYGKNKMEFESGDYMDISRDAPLKIKSPSNNIKYEVSLNKNINFQKIPLLAYGYPDSENFYWYVNGKFIGKSKVMDNMFFIPEEKEINISVVDEKGRVGAVNIKVNFINK